MQHFSASAQEKQERAVLSGKIISAEDSSSIDFADIFLKGTEYWSSADKNGEFRLEAPVGTYTMVVSAVGFKPYKEEVTLQAGSDIWKAVTIKPDHRQLDEVVVVSNRSSHVQRSAFNALDLSVKEMHNSSKSLG